MPQDWDAETNMTRQEWSELVNVSARARRERSRGLLVGRADVIQLVDHFSIQLDPQENQGAPLSLGAPPLKSSVT